MRLDAYTCQQCPVVFWVARAGRRPDMRWLCPACALPAHRVPPKDVYRTTRAADDPQDPDA